MMKEVHSLKRESEELTLRLAESEATVGKLRANNEQLNNEMSTRRKLFTEELQVRPLDNAFMSIPQCSLIANNHTPGSRRALQQKPATACKHAGRV